MTILIDRSNNNSGDDYAAAHKAGVTHLYAKASEGTGFTDSTYKARIAAGRAAGMVVGAYHFAAHADPVAEATFFLNIVGKPPPGHLRPCLDLESGESAAWAGAFVEHCHKVLGYYPALYGNTSTIPALRSANASVHACPWWRAEFSVNDGKQHPLQGGDMGAAAHQYTSTASFPGITGHTDASVFLNEKAMLVPTAAPPKPVKPKAAVIHYTTRAGKQESATVKRPIAWQITHPKVWWHGEFSIHPVKK